MKLRIIIFIDFCYVGSNVFHRFKEKEVYVCLVSDSMLQNFLTRVMLQNLIYFIMSRIFPLHIFYSLLSHLLMIYREVTGKI